MSFADGTESSQPLSVRADLSFDLSPGKRKTIRHGNYFLEDKMPGKYIVLFACPVVDGAVRGLVHEDFGGVNKICSPHIFRNSAIEVTSGHDGSLQAVGFHRLNQEPCPLFSYDAPAVLA